MTTWYTDPRTNVRHRGSVYRGRVAAACGTSFPSGATTIELPPGESPTDTTGCPDCPTGTTAHVADEDHPARTAAVVGVPRLRQHTRHGLTAAFGAALLTVVAVAVFVYVAWPR